MTNSEIVSEELTPLQHESARANELGGMIAFLVGVLAEVRRCATLESAKTLAEMGLSRIEEYRAGSWRPGPGDDPAGWRAFGSSPPIADRVRDAVQAVFPEFVATIVDPVNPSGPGAVRIDVWRRSVNTDFGDVAHLVGAVQWEESSLIEMIRDGDSGVIRETTQRIVDLIRLRDLNDPGFLPSQVDLSGIPPLVGTCGKLEAEVAMAVIVRTCQARGDRWRPVSWSEATDVIREDVRSGREPAVSWMRNPFLRPSTPDLVGSRCARNTSAADRTPEIELTKSGFAALRRWVRR